MGDARAVSNNTADTSTAAVRSSTASAKRSARAAAGSRHPLDLDARLRQPSELSPQAVELAGRRHQPAGGP